MARPRSKVRSTYLWNIFEQSSGTFWNVLELWVFSLVFSLVFYATVAKGLSMNDKASCTDCRSSFGSNVENLQFGCCTMLHVQRALEFDLRQATVNGQDFPSQDRREAVLCTVVGSWERGSS